MAVVDDFLNQLGTKFSNISGELIGKRTAHVDLIIHASADKRPVDEMSRRLDNLEATIAAGNADAEIQSETRT